MRIHLLSDLHLETGIYRVPSDLDCDVIVAAGDVGNGTQGIEFFKTLDKPVVYVAGNHEHWSNRVKKIDMFQIQRNIRQSAENSNVHFLENDSVVIDGVKFVGATMWTNLGSINYALSPGYMDEAAQFMRDSCISCFEFYQDEELSKAFHSILDRYLHVSRQCDAQARKDYALECEKEGKFHPIVGLVLHRQSVEFIENETRVDRDNPQKSIVVTHHHPSYKSLKPYIHEDRITERKRRLYEVGREPSHGYLEAAAYASELDIFSAINNTKDFVTHGISHWLCGHLHTHMDYLHTGGVRISCNPRGRSQPPVTEDTKIERAMMGFPLSTKEFEKLKDEYKKNPYQGDCRSFDPRFIIDTDESVAPVLSKMIEDLVPKLNELLEQLKSIGKLFDATHLHLFEVVFEKFFTVLENFDDLVNDFTREFNTCEVVLSKRLELVTRTFFRTQWGNKVRKFTEETADKIRVRVIPLVIEYRQFLIDTILQFKGLSFAELNYKLENTETWSKAIYNKYFLQPDELTELGF